jgi:hypothetical protein
MDWKLMVVINIKVGLRGCSSHTVILLRRPHTSLPTVRRLYVPPACKPYLVDLFCMSSFVQAVTVNSSSGLRFLLCAECRLIISV